MRKLALGLMLLSSPAAATGIEITVQGQHTQGVITVDLLEDVAPNHTARIVELANGGFYDNVYFHRVIDGFMAQTGDGEFGKVEAERLARAGTGGSDLPDLKAEFSELTFERGVMGMARSQSEDSANSQFFLMFADGPFLDGKYTVVGRVTGGFDVLDNIKRGDSSTRQITGMPDVMTSVRVVE